MNKYIISFVMTICISCNMYASLIKGNIWIHLPLYKSILLDDVDMYSVFNPKLSELFFYNGDDDEYEHLLLQNYPVSFCMLECMVSAYARKRHIIQDGLLQRIIADNYAPSLSSLYEEQNILKNKRDWYISMYSLGFAKQELPVIDKNLLKCKVSAIRLCEYILLQLSGTLQKYATEYDNLSYQCVQDKNKAMENLKESYNMLCAKEEVIEQNLMLDEEVYRYKIKATLAITIGILATAGLYVYTY